MTLIRSRARKQGMLFHIATVALVLGVLAAGQSLIGREAPDFDAACAAGEPFFVAASYRAQSARNRPPSVRGPSIVLFRDTPSDRPAYVLATYLDTGTVWGLAYRHSEPAVYAAAYQKRALPLGPDGAGAIYRIDLKTGVASHFADVPDAGVSRRGAPMSRGERDYDMAAARSVGKTSLGDIDISEDESELYVMNLESRRIYRLSMDDGSVLGSFDHGASGEAWVDNARPFGLAVHEGKLFHGVVNAGGSSRSLVAKVYRSEPDGADMTEVAEVELNYRRDGIRLRTVSGASVRWSRWTDSVPTRRVGERPRLHNAQPMLVDLDFTSEGEMVLGLRDRWWDIETQYIEQEETVGPTVAVHPPSLPTAAPPVFLSEEGLGFGDLLLGKPEAPSWTVVSDPEHFDDSNQLRHGESAFGGVAAIPGTRSVVAGAYGVKDARSDVIVGEEGAYWFDSETGNKTGQEALGNPGVFQDYDTLLRADDIARAHTTTEIYLDFEYHRDIASMGDVEVLCVSGPEVPTEPVTPSPDLPTDTLEPPTPTTAPSDTPTPPPSATPPPTDTPTPEPQPRYLPVVLGERCDPERVRADFVLVIDASSSMTGAKLAAAKAAAKAFIGELMLPEDQVGVAVFNHRGWVASPLAGEAAPLFDAIDAIEVEPGTRIDLGLDAAAEILTGPERIETNVPVVIVLTDGIQELEPERPLSLALALREDGVILHAIGLGADVDRDYLLDLAGVESRVHFSPSTAELADIYARIAKLVPCGPGSYWGGR